MNISFLEALRMGWARFCLAPLQFALATLLFLLLALTAILTGPAALLWMWYVSPERPVGPLGNLVGGMTLLNRLHGTNRIPAAFWLGLVIWVFGLLPGFHHALLSIIPLCVLLVQPLWLALVFVDRYNLRLSVALKSVTFLCLNAPSVALPAMAFGLLGWSGALLFGVGILITLPIAIHAQLRWLQDRHIFLVAAIQKAS